MVRSLLRRTAVVLALSSFAGTAARLMAACKDVQGKIQEQLVPCGSNVFCTVAQISGNVKGVATFAGTGIFQAPDGLLLIVGNPVVSNAQFENKRGTITISTHALVD